MTTLRTILRPIRPRFSVSRALSPEVVLSRIDQALEAPGCRMVGSVLDRHVELLVEPRRRHFWSPWLSAEVSARGDGSEVRGRFGPHPHLWTLFIALYAIWSFCVIGALVYGYAQWTLGRAPTALWVIPLATVAALIQYVASIVGQRLGTRQMAAISRFIKQAIGTAEPGGSEHTADPVSHQLPDRGLG